MGFSQGLSCVVIIQCLRADGFHIFKVSYIRVHLGLAAAVDASARTSHDLYKMIICLARTDFVHDYFCVA